MNKQKIIDSILKNDAVLSRTAQSGTGDTSASTLKIPLRLTGAALKDSVIKNRIASVEYILGCPPNVLSSTHDFFTSTLTLASLTSKNMLPEGLFRSWRLPAGRQFGPACDSIEVLPSNIWLSLEEICKESVEQLFKGRDAIEVAAIIEWHIGVGPLHPFYDACGRISRSVSALVLQLNGLSIKHHQSRKDYFEAGASGIEKFTHYYHTLE